MKCVDTEHLLEISEFMPVVVVDVCAKSFTAFDETALAAVLRQARGLLPLNGDFRLTAVGFTGSDIYDRCRARAD